MALRFPPVTQHTDPSWQDFDRLCDERFDGWVEELRDFCTIPCETDQFAELDRGAEWVEQRLLAAGAEVTVLREDGVPPLVIGEMGAGPRTLIAVQHYDVQPAAPLDLWDSPPYDPQVRDGRLYARGVCDDKGELLHRIQAAEALRDANGELPCRVRFIVEGEEESDSAHLAPLLSRRPEFFEGARRPDRGRRRRREGAAAARLRRARDALRRAIGTHARVRRPFGRRPAASRTPPGG